MRRRHLPLIGLLFPLLLAPAGCMSGAERGRILRDNEGLRRDKERLERTVAERDATIASLQQQTVTLKGFGPDRPADLFAPVKLEIASLSGGADYDGKPGDDGITVYLRPRDADGDVVKVPGRMKVQLVDNTDLGSPRVLGVFTFDDFNEVRKTWHGKFGTQHFTIKCPFPPGVELPKSRRVLVSAEFLDLLSGATLTASKDVAFSVPEP
jgi:hypothetical protein